MKKVKDYLSSLITGIQSLMYTEKEFQEEWDKLEHEITFSHNSTDLTEQHRKVLKDLSDWSIKFNTYLHVISKFEDGESTSISEKRALNAIQYVQMCGGKIVVSTIMQRGGRCVKLYIY
jgi:hypothetical protein